MLGGSAAGNPFIFWHLFEWLFEDTRSVLIEKKTHNFIPMKKENQLSDDQIEALFKSPQMIEKRKKADKFFTSPQFAEYVKGKKKKKYSTVNLALKEKDQ